MSRAIAGREVAITVESRFSMNRAQATIRGVRMREDMNSVFLRGRLSDHAAFMCLRVEIER
jgi:hypothetical protein